MIDSQSLSVQEVEVRGNLNTMKLSPDGNWVVCYHDLNGENGDQGTGGAISYNAISIVNLETLEHTEAMAGAFPKDVQFSGDSSLGVVISDDYLSTIDFTQTPPTLHRIPIADDLVNPPLAEEVLLDPKDAMPSSDNTVSTSLVLVDLETSGDPISMLDVGANPTDMDVSPGRYASDGGGTCSQRVVDLRFARPNAGT